MPASWRRLLACGAALFSAAPLAAQGVEVDSSGLRARFPPDTLAAVGQPAASPTLPAGHWAFRALQRLNALGLLSQAFDAGAPSLTCARAAALLQEARGRAQDRPQAAALVAGYDSLFRRDPYGCPGSGSGVTATASAGWEALRGRMAAGIGYAASDWSGARPLSDTVSPLLSARLALVGAHASAVLAPEVRGGGLGLSEGQVVVGGGGLAFWAGKRRFRFGPAAGGGIVLSDASVFVGGGAYLPRSIRFPWIFRAMGPIHLETFVSQVEGGDSIRNPYFLGFRGSMAPHPRVLIGLSRAAMFGGRGNDPMTFRNMQFLLLGESGRSYRFANDLLSADVQWRPPLGRAPLLTYVEAGMDDAAGAWHHEPGVVAGAYLGALPGAPALAAGLEWTYFAPHYFQNTIWYRNAWLRQGWTDAGRPLGSPLGGQGQQGLLYLDALGWQGRIEGRFSVFYRYRGPENLLAPERQGHSRGGAARVQVQAARRASLYLRWSGDLGAGWSESELQTGLLLRMK